MNGGSEGEKAALKALRVIHVVRSDGFAGVERYISTVAPELARRGLRVEVIGGNAARMNLALAPAGVTHRSAATSPGVARALARSGRADILHAHMTAAELVSIAMAPLLRARVVSTRHFAHRRGVPRIVDRAMARGLAAQIGISEFAAQVCGGVTVVIPGKPWISLSQRRTAAPRPSARNRSA